MPAQKLDGKALSAKLRDSQGRRVREALGRGCRAPGLAVVLVGDDPASQVYVGKKEKAAAEVGVAGAVVRLAGDSTQAQMLARVRALAADPAVDGILVQLPLPRGIDTDAVLAAIPVEKDVDGFHPFNLGELALGHETRVACTPRGVIALLDAAGFTYAGARALVIGRSRIVGKPMSYLLVNRSCTVTVAHSRSRDLAALVAGSDLVVAAVGVEGLVKAEWIRPGTWVVDVGMNRNAAGKLVGDVEPAAVERAGWITPVPGGVGPMTIAMLLEATLEAWARTGASGPAAAAAAAAG